MTIRSAALLAAVSCGSLFAAAETGIEFSGVLTAGGKTRIALTDKAKKTTTWVEPGDSFNGYTVARYDAAGEAVFLRKGTEETRVGMVASRTVEARAPTAAESTPAAVAAAAAIRTNLRLLAAAARQYQLQRGATSVGYTDLVGPDKLIKELKPVAGENYSTLNFGPTVTGVSVTTASGATITHELPPVAATAANPVPAAPTGLPATPALAPPSVATPLPSPVGSSAAPSTAAAAATPYPIPDAVRASPTFTIRSGDTWEKVSEVTGLTVPQLKQLNPGVREGTPLPAGQALRTR